MLWCRSIAIIVVASIVAFSSNTAPADEEPIEKTPPANAKPSPGALMDYGPFLSSSLSAPAAAGKPRITAYKSLNIKLGNGAYVSFDTDLLRYSCGWTGDWLNLAKTHMTTSKGSVCPQVGGTIIFSTRIVPGVSHGGSLADPRNDPLHPNMGPLPKDHAHYQGLYAYNDAVVLAYSAGGGKILEFPAAAQVAGATLFTRTFRVEKTTEALTFVLGDDAPALSAEIIDSPAGAAIVKSNGNLCLNLPAIPHSAVFTIAIGHGNIGAAVKSLAKFPDPSTLIQGGRPRWKQRIETLGKLASDQTSPYVVDTLTLPETNPWSAWMRASAFDFFPDGKSAALATWNGDVWIVSGIDETLSHLIWKRFATGLYEPLGLKIVNGTIYVTGRDQVTRLHDLNNDGEADYYENFNNDGVTGDQYHLFKFDLDTDPAGNFYYSIVGAWAGNDLHSTHGRIAKVSADGSKLEYIGSGLRAANGLAVGPTGEIVTGDNQGHWMPTSKINYIPSGKTDGFYGMPFDPRIEKEFDVKRFFPSGLPKTFEPPLCWIPYSLDNSSGGQVFVTSDKWGPFKGHIIHSSYGTSKIFMVMHEEVDGVSQGGVWRFPLVFESGIMRLRFNPGDGQLYACGLRGWQTAGAKDGCFQRVRFTGKPIYEPKELHANSKGISITFTDPVDPASAKDAGSYDIEQWNYKWSSAYGSADYSVSNPTKKGHDTVDIQSAKLQADGRTVYLEIPSIAPVMQMSITYKLKATDGHGIDGAVYNTINTLK